MSERRGPRAASGAALLAAALSVVILLQAGCSASAQTPTSYYCPMHPQVTADRAGDCPICGMHLVPQAPGKEAAATPAHAGTAPAGLAPVDLDALARERLGLTVETAQRRPVGKALQAPARIVADETRIYRVIARAEGFVDHLGVQYAGQRVGKEQELLSINSPSIQAAQQQYISTTPVEGRRFTPPAGKPPGAAAGGERDDAYRQSLRYWGFGEKQIDRIQQSGKAENSLVLVAPAGGFVTEKNALLGQKVFPGDLLMVVTDLSRVWAEAEVSEMDAPSVRVGMPMSVRLPSMPGRTFEGRVKFFQPLLDPQSHTMKVVVELANPDGALKPGMIASAELEAAPHDALTVPVSAVLRAGTADYAFVEKDGRWIPRSLVLGVRDGRDFEVVSGLAEGDRVATSANFLLDSESSLQAWLQAARAQR